MAILYWYVPITIGLGCFVVSHTSEMVSQECYTMTILYLFVLIVHEIACFSYYFNTYYLDFLQVDLQISILSVYIENKRICETLKNIWCTIWQNKLILYSDWQQGRPKLADVKPCTSFDNSQWISSAENVTVSIPADSLVFNIMWLSLLSTSLDMEFTKSKTMIVEFIDPMPYSFYVF